MKEDVAGVSVVYAVARSMFCPVVDETTHTMIFFNSKVVSLLVEFSFVLSNDLYEIMNLYLLK